jgi:hypothetical protein
MIETYDKLEVTSLSLIEGEEVFEVNLRRPKADAIVFWIRRRDLEMLRE